MQNVSLLKDFYLRDNNPTYIFFLNGELVFHVPSNGQANLTNEHCTSESVFVACAHITNENNLVRVQIPHPSPISFPLIHHFFSSNTSVP